MSIPLYWKRMIDNAENSNPMRHRIEVHNLWLYNRDNFRYRLVLLRDSLS